MQPIGENPVNTPAFLGKLWKMVNDPSTDHLICWSAAGNSFIIQNQAQFWYELLPLYYKHNNMSSFVRQLNMYGFHKMSTVENGSMDADRDEIQFMHPFFQKDQPELLRNIKRKATTAKAFEQNPKHDELSKVLTDVKQLRGRQSSVDHQLNAIKQENGLLWREVALLRNKHFKQQKIVNKLIQFLVTLVQPSRMTMGLKRIHPLMLHESPCKKTKTSDKGGVNMEGPTIHELDNELDLNSDLYEEEVPLIDSPVTSTTSQQSEVSSPLHNVLIEGNEDSNQQNWDKPEFVSIGAGSPSDLIEADEITGENLINTLESNTLNRDAVNPQKVFLNPTTQDTLLSNLIKSSSGDGASKNRKKTLTIKADDLNLFGINLSSSPADSNNMAVATRDKLCDIKSMPSTSDSYSEDLSNHVESTQNELEQFKDILNGYNPYVDANALLGLFNEDSHPQLNVNLAEAAEKDTADLTDPLVSGSELAPYGTSFDFTELFDDSADGDNAVSAPAAPVANVTSSTVNTPQIMNNEPIFPTTMSKK